MDHEKIREEIAKALKEVLSEQELSNLEEKVEEALAQAKDVIDDLRARLTEKEAKEAEVQSAIEALEEEKSQLTEKVSTLESEVATLTATKDELEERASKAEELLLNLEKDKIESARMAELEEANVARKGDKRDAQVSVIREMSDEEFAAYKEDLVALRNEFIEGLQGESASEEEDKEEEELETPPADIDAARRETASIVPISYEPPKVGTPDYERANRVGATIAKLMERK